jgi:hypothetical protein
MKNVHTPAKGLAHRLFFGKTANDATKNCSTVMRTSCSEYLDRPQKFPTKPFQIHHPIIQHHTVLTASLKISAKKKTSRSKIKHIQYT